MEWQIEKVSSFCNKCNKEFGSTQKVYCSVRMEGETFIRENFCEACWASPLENVLSFWIVDFTKKPVIDIDLVEQFFKNMNETVDPKLRYLAALVLVRKKRLKLLGSKGSNIVVEKHWDGEKLEIVDPQIRESETESLRLELAKVLGIPPDSL